ncbi:hypothetical protein N0V83_008276 [Neocucurbitaria cava]|uniref:Uncharacterized protein n=1 Tax=Neocucurbitaria cava TaxID=798079 RepID=A0A9W8Y4T1_9PLEO|nr:hypothetical protein N0V83_008276 [Neocucurbitaria cava]
MPTSEPMIIAQQNLDNNAPTVPLPPATVAWPRAPQTVNSVENPLPENEVAAGDSDEYEDDTNINEEGDDFDDPRFN